MLEPIPIFNDERSSEEELAGASPAAHNIVIDRSKAVRRRPGVQQYTTAAFNTDGNPVEFVHRTFDGSIYAVQRESGILGKPVYRMAGVDAARTELGRMNSDKRVMGAETEGMLALAGGWAPHRVELATHQLEPLGGSPPRATHVAGNSARLLLNDIDEPSRVRYSDVQLGTVLTGHETWPALNVFAAEARPDRVVAVAENTNEVFVWGETTLQVFAPDPSFVFATTAAREYGTPAPYSIIKRDQKFSFLDHQRRIIVTDGRSFEEVSQGIQKTLDELEVVSDCFGFWVLMGSYDCLVWTFPTDGVTFVYQAGIWSRWTGWDPVSSNWKWLDILAFHQRPDDKTPVVGTASGRIGRLSLGATDDLGEPIRAYVQTGYLDRGTDAKKQCKRVRIALRRGVSANPSGPQAWLGWRDRPGAFQRIPIDLGDPGETDIVVSLNSLGVYRRRQWLFEFGVEAELSLAGITEDFDVLDY